MIGVAELGWQWREAGWLWLLGAVLLSACWRHWRRPAARLAAARVFAAAQPPLPATRRQRLAQLVPFVELGGAGLLVVALARPVVVEPEPPVLLGRDLLLCLDRSSSMAAQDLAPGRSRLEIAVDLARQFVAARTTDRLGFVTFARFSDLGCPPTADRAAVAELLAGVRLVAPDGPEDATAIGAAVAMAASLLERSAAAGKVIVLLTDGEENVAVAGARDQIAPAHAAAFCRQLDVRVHVIVVGRGDELPDGSFAPLDVTAVRELAAATGGRFLAAADDATLAAAYAAIDASEAAKYAPPGVRVRECFPLPLLAGLLLWALAHALRCSAAGGLP